MTICSKLPLLDSESDGWYIGRIRWSHRICFPWREDPPWLEYFKIELEKPFENPNVWNHPHWNVYFQAIFVTRSQLLTMSPDISWIIQGVGTPDHQAQTTCSLFVDGKDFHAFLEKRCQLFSSESLEIVAILSNNCPNCPVGASLKFFRTGNWSFFRP